MIQDHDLSTPIEISEQDGERQSQTEIVAHIQSAVEGLERALTGLRDLSQQPGYEFVDRLLPGYTWAVEQTHELNESLIQRTSTPAGRPE